MQNWDAMQPTANYDQHNAWYNSMFAANIKTEPGTTSPQHISPLQSPTTSAMHTALATPTSQLESYLKQQHMLSSTAAAPMDTMSAMTPSPSQNDNNSMQHFFDSNMQQQLYQQQFQQAQQAAAQNQQLNANPHMPLGFNPLTPPGLPNAVLPSMTHFYQQQQQQQQQQQHPHNLHLGGQQTPSPQLRLSTPCNNETEKLQCTLTPRNTPPMNVTPPKSPLKVMPQEAPLEKEQDLISNSSEDMKYIADSEDDEAIRLPIYNSHGKMKNYKCKTCGLVAITKIAFWEHTRAHMKPEKILQCPKCPFVTELKHHLEYHIRKHKNLKPFQCDKCSYSCVNKSMLNSHRKSHSSVYQYRCADCDYATKYCHSFKLHLRKYDHKPGMVLDEEGIPNPSVVIDVYGTRRGPKTKAASGVAVSTTHKRHAAEARLSVGNLNQTSVNSQLSAALQGFPMPQQQQQQQHLMPASPAKSSASSTASDLPTLTLNMSLQQQQLQQQHAQTQAANTSNQAMSNLLPPLASILQQNHNMAFFPYWNLNMQMLAAQQQAAVLAQMSPRMRETALQHLQNQQQLQQQHLDSDERQSMHEDDDEAEEFDRKSIDSAMDLSQGTPSKEEPQPQAQQTPEVAMNLKLHEEAADTPLMSSMSASRRKGRVLKLDTLLQAKTAEQQLQRSGSPKEMPTASSPISIAAPPPAVKLDEHSSADESMETTTNATHVPTTSHNAANTSASSTASSSGNSSNSSNSSGSPATSPPSSAIYECKYCDIYFKDAVLYTIHMGYHSCDDVFKCNMCGEKCDGPVGLFVHMARNAHS